MFISQSDNVGEKKNPIKRNQLKCTTGTHLAMVLIMLSSSSVEGGLRPPGGKTRLMGSKSRDNDFDK